MFGVQWDLVLKHLSNKGVSDSLLKTDSSTWGNYTSQPFMIDRGKYSTASPWNTFIDYTTATENKVTVENGVSTKLQNKNVLLTTGASDNNSRYNIYDLAGSVRELTLEKSTSNGSCRGGKIYGNGTDDPASHRGCISPTGTSEDLGFLFKLY